MKAARLVSFTFIFFLPFIASAQSASSDYVLLGAGVRSRPAYDGSASQVTELIPVVRYYGAPWFARTTQGILEGGARFNLGNGLALGAQIAYEPGRESSESSFLRDNNVPDLDPGASFGLHVEWDGRLGPSPVNLLARLRQHFDEDRGAQVDGRFTAGIYAPSPRSPWPPPRRCAPSTAPTATTAASCPPASACSAITI
jgi:MltA-interacting protein MipA